MTQVRESGHGHVDKLVSLGGIQGIPHLGRTIEVFNGDVDATTIFMIPENPKRISILISNRSMSGNWLVMRPGDPSNQEFNIYQGESFQFDSNLPYIGAIYFYGNALCHLTAIEISVP